MRLICISRGTYSGGQELAEKLADKLGCTCLGREELISAATEAGISVGKLEMAMVSSGIFSEKLARERDHYLAFSTAYLCEKAAEGSLVYHGRTGHLLLPGVPNILRVRVLADEEYRIKSVKNKLGLDRDKARRYIQDVDEDRRKWVHSMYGTSLEDAANFDIIVNLAKMNLDNSASALLAVTQLPDFQLTPASKKALDDLLLGARARIKLARDNRTYTADVKVRADSGVVTVTYLPQDANLADAIPEVCSDLPGLKDIRTTMAMTNILWIEENFDPQSKTYNQVVDIATKWNAAVELVKLVDEEENPSGNGKATELAGDRGTVSGTGEYNGGIEDDTESETGGDEGLKQTLDKLALAGKSGGGKIVYGGRQQLLDSIDRTIPYTLVVIGELALSKGHAASLRATRELMSFLGERMKAPVATTDELGTQYLFGKRDIVQVVFYLAVSACLYFLVLTHQDFVMGFLAHSGWYADAIKDTPLAENDWMSGIIVSLAVFLLVPIISYSYGTVARAILKFIRME